MVKFGKLSPLQKGFVFFKVKLNAFDRKTTIKSKMRIILSALNTNNNYIMMFKKVKASKYLYN